MTTLTKGTIVDTSNPQPVQLIYMYFSFYNITSIRAFTSMLTVFFEKPMMLWVFPTASK